MNKHLRTRIKICGITRLQDALHAVNSGADALGFVFYAKSPRYITPAAAAEIINKLPPFVTAVGLFVNAEQTYIDEVVQVCGLDVIQLHGDESPAFCTLQTKRVIKAVAIAEPNDLGKVASYPCTILLDAKAPEGVYGGTGQSFDWGLLKNLHHQYPLMIAGGLNAENINQALDSFDWFAVDVSSGVESSKGIKDKEKMNLFCTKVHQYRSKV